MHTKYNTIHADLRDLIIALKCSIDPHSYYTSQLGSVCKCTNHQIIFLCPFHDDRKHPNFTVTITGQYRHSFICFACDAKGDLILFHQKFHNLNFSEAINDLISNYASHLQIAN